MRVSEIYLSVQGEGPRVGRPTVFVRFGGCNLKCPGWPCDTQHAIDPKYRHEWGKLTPLQVYHRILEEAMGIENYNVCFTGGEPFLQPKAELDELIKMLIVGDNNLRWIECFSNGTLLYTSYAMANVCFVMDWKLDGSGEGSPSDERMNNFMRMSFKDSVKFTIKDRNDYEQAKRIYILHRDTNSMVQWYYGAVWGHLDNAELIKWVLEDRLPWTFTMQVHNHVWDREKRGI